jgi:hypothetical protein
MVRADGAVVVEGVTQLSIDELALLCHDLALDMPAGISKVNVAAWTEAHCESVRRGLVARNMVLLHDLGAVVHPALEHDLRVASSPALFVSVDRLDPDGQRSCQLFCDPDHAVQQVISPNGVIRWAPFDLTRMGEALVELTGLTPRGEAGPQVSAPQDAFAEVDRLIGAHQGDAAVRLLTAHGNESRAGQRYVEASRAATRFVALTVAHGEAGPQGSTIVLTWFADDAESTWLVAVHDGRVAAQQCSGSEIIATIESAMPPSAGNHPDEVDP